MAIKPTATTKQLLKAIRDAEKAGVTRYQISKLSGVSQAQICRMMQGQRLPRLDTAERLANAIGMKLILVSKE